MSSFWPVVAVATVLCFAGCGEYHSTAGVPLGVVGTSGRPLPALVFAPSGSFQGMVLFASGDGGWKGFEDRICQSLARQGYCVVGWDCLAYSKPGFYDQKTLASDFDTAIRSGAKAVGAPRAPLVMAGYSTGAEQVVAAAAASQRPSGLCGVVAIAPGWRGRYGITTSDLMGIAPSGEASFALEEHAPGLAGLRFFQIHGEHDPLAQTDWLKTLTIPHKLAVYPNGWHTFGGGPEDFQTLVCQAVGWVKSGRP